MRHALAKWKRLLLKVTGKEGCQIRTRIILDKVTNILEILKKMRTIMMKIQPLKFGGG